MSSRTSKPLSRRDFLRLMAAGTGGAALAATTPTFARSIFPMSTPKRVSRKFQASVSGNLVIMYSVEELSDEQLELFTDRYPELTVERIPSDGTRLKAMIAAGTPPDVFQLGGAEMAPFLAQGALLDLNDFFAASDVLRLDDLAPANSFFRWDGERIGQGDVYGMAKDWSPDFSLWINPAAFEEAGIEAPSDDTVLTYAQLAEYAAALTVRSGDRVERIGMTYEGYNMDAVVQFRLAEEGASLYSDDLRTVVLKDSPAAIEALRYFYDLSLEGYTWSPLNPSPNGWNGKDFQVGLVGVGSNGYWYSGLLRSDDAAPMYNVARMLPAPTWGTMRYSPAYGPSGAVIAAGTQNPEAAWAFFEFINAGEPAQERAASGWGVPALISLTELMPQESEFDQQTYRVVQDEIANAAYIREVNPYFAAGPAFENAWRSNLELALRDEITFEQLVENMDAEMNLALQDGLSAAGL